jgi:hypothetical protein
MAEIITKLKKQLVYNNENNKFFCINSTKFPTEEYKFSIYENDLLIKKYQDSGDNSYIVKVSKVNNELRLCRKNGNELNVNQKLIDLLS